MATAEVVHVPQTSLDVERQRKKNEWAREYHRDFVTRHGYSKAAYYATGGLREAVLRRDNSRCVKCGMSDRQHRTRWSRPITIDHKDKNRKNNTLENLQALCLSCHGKKDNTNKLREKVPVWKSEVISLRRKKVPYQVIADSIGASIGSVWKWWQRWNREVHS